MAISILVTILAAVGDVASPEKDLSKGGMYCFELPGKVTMNDLRVRKPLPDSRDLLLCRLVVAEVLERLSIDEKGASGAFRTEVHVFSYDQKKKTLTQVEVDRWKDAKGVITDYASFGLLDKNVSPMEDNLKLILWHRKTGIRQIPTKGAWVMRVGFSVEGKHFPALSRDKKPERLTNEPSAHYVEVFTYPEGKPVGKPYKLPFTDFRNIEPVCWSSGDTHLVISTEDGKHVCIIEIPEQAEEKK